MSELQDLYQQLILDHNARPRNFGVLASATHKAEGHNPLCGDNCAVEVAVVGDRIDDIKFQGSGCAISKASASLMTSFVKGRTLTDVERAFESFHSLLTSDAATWDESLGKLAAFAGVRAFPMRVKCATLAWHTLKAALEDESQSVTTE